MRLNIAVITISLLGTSYGTTAVRAEDTPYARRDIHLQRGVLRMDEGPADFTLRSGNRGFVISKPFAAVPVDEDAFALRRDPSRITLGQGGFDFGDDFGDGSGDQGGGSNVTVFLGSGAGIGITDEIEAGLVLFPLQFAPDFAYGDIDLYGRYLVLNEGDLQIALQADIILPTGSYFGLASGAALLYRLGENARLDAGAVLQISFAEPDTVVGMSLPVAFNYSVSNKVFLGGRSGFGWQNMSDSSYFAMPLGVQGGVALADGLLDLVGWFQWPYFLTPAADRKVNADLWEIGVGASIFVDVFH